MDTEYDNNQKNALKYRLTGAGFWLLLLIIIVPTWYANPVEFNPNGLEKSVEEKKIVTKSFKLPSSSNLTQEKEVVKAEAPKIEKQKPFNPSVTWLVKIAAYKNKQQATELNDRLRYSYQSSVKYFPNSKYYSVRIGPYEDKEEALKDQKDLNKLLHINTTLVTIKNNFK